MDYVATDWGTVVARRNSRKALEQGGWSAFFTYFSGFDEWNPSAHNPIRGHGENGWAGWPDSPAIERQRDAWFDAPDEAAQQRICREMQEVALTRDVPYVPLGMYYQPTAYRRNLQGLLKGSRRCSGTSAALIAATVRRRGAAACAPARFRLMRAGAAPRRSSGRMTRCCDATFSPDRRRRRPPPRRLRRAGAGAGDARGARGC